MVAARPDSCWNAADSRTGRESSRHSEPLRVRCWISMGGCIWLHGARRRYVEAAAIILGPRGGERTQGRYTVRAKLGLTPYTANVPNRTTTCTETSENRIDRPTASPTPTGPPLALNP